MGIMTKTELKRSVVDHTYRDYSQVMLTDSDDCMKQWNADLFPAKLHKILSTPEYAHIITWKPHGRAWEIVNRPLFLEVVVPRHFHHANFGSFNRSVNGWGFKVRRNYVTSHRTNIMRPLSLFLIPPWVYHVLFMLIPYSNNTTAACGGRAGS